MIDPAARRHVLDAIYGAAIDTKRWPQALTLVADAIGAEGGMIAFHPPRAQDGFQILGRLRQDLTDLYMRTYTGNPVEVAMRTAPRNTALLPDLKPIRRTAFFADIFIPQRLEGIANTVHPGLCRAGGSGGFGFPLTIRQLDDSDAVLRRLQSLNAHLHRAIDLSLDVGQRLAVEPQIARVVAAMPGPSLLIDDGGGIVLANQPAEDMLFESDGLSARWSEAAPLRLVAVEDADDRALAAAIRSSVAIARGLGDRWIGTVRVARRSRPPLTVMVTPLPDSNLPFSRVLEPQPRVLVQVLGFSRIAAGQVQAFRDAFGLTIAEARIAKLIGEGLPVPAVAAALDLSPYTVKTHLGRCFDKTAARSQAELARLIGGMPPPG